MGWHIPQLQLIFWVDWTMNNNVIILPKCELVELVTLPISNMPGYFFQQAFLEISMPKLV